MTAETIIISPRRITGSAALLALADLGLGYAREISGFLGGIPSSDVGFNLIGLDGEGTASAWFSSVLMAGIAGLMLWSAGIEAGRGWRSSWGWAMLGLVFIYFSFDEMSSIHEQLQFIVPDIPFLAGIYSPFRWVMIGLPAAIVGGIIFLPFLVALPRSSAIRLFVAGFIYVSGAAGIELLEGMVYAAQGPSITYVIMMMLEETMEIAGLLLALRCVSLHLATVLDGPALRVAGRP